MKNKIIYITLILIIGIFAFCVILLNKKTNDNVISTSNAVLSNKKIGWGIKRNDNHEQPDLGKENKELLEKYNGIVMGNSEKKYIYLTFDCGYEAGYTAKILDILKEKNVKAAFFITAHYLNTAPELIERMITEGHIVGNHTVNHPSMPGLSDEKINDELMNLNQKLYEKYNYEMKYMRPPKGEFSERTLQITESLGFKTVMWSFAYVDWDENSQPNKNEALNKIISNLHSGEIMLLHATSKTNSEIMGELIDNVEKEGYIFKSLDEFC